MTDAVHQTSPAALHTLSVEDRLQLLKFVCAFAWADFTVKQTERDLVGRIAQRCGLDADEAAQVEAWLQSPPNPDEIDPLDVPQAHRQLKPHACTDIELVLFLATGARNHLAVLKSLALLGRLHGYLMLWDKRMILL